MSVRRGDQVFIVRTWLESPGDTRTMRGHIDHVPSGTRRYFANFGDLCDFISTAQMFEPPPKAGEDDASGNAPETVPG